MSQKESACAHKIAPRARNYDLNCTRTTLTAEHKTGDRCISCQQNTGCEKLYLCIFTTNLTESDDFRLSLENLIHLKKNLDDFSRSGNIPSFICEKESEWPLYQLQLHVATPATGKSTNLANLKVNPKDIGLQKRTRNLPKCLPDSAALTTTNSKYGFIRMNFALEQYKQIYARQYHLEESIYNRRFCLCVCL